MIKTIITALGLGATLALPLHAAELYKNFEGYHTPNRQLSQFSAMVVDNNKVVATGDFATLQAKYPKAQIIDLDGKTLLPGLIDGHGHVTGLGLNLQRISLREVGSEGASVDKVVAFAKSNPQLSWIRGRGWNQELWPTKAFPTKKSLDEKIANKPVWLRRIDGHAGWANSKALALAGITRDSVSPPGGEIIKDENGEPTGVLIDNAMDLLEANIPSSSHSEIKNAISLASDHLASIGITSVHDAGIGGQVYRALGEMAKDKQLPIRIYGMLSVVANDYPQMLKTGIINTKDDQLVIRSVKISADGALGSRGAAMLEPYTDDADNTGLLLHTPKSLKDNMKKAIDAGFQVNVHAIGDKANHLALNYFEEFNNDKKSRDLRHRIEHAQVVKPSDLPRFKTLGVLPSMQPTHATSDMNMAENRVGHARIKGAYAWRTLLDDGVRVVSGSDFPIEYANPFYGLHAAVTRQDRNNQPPLGWLSHESMTLAQALNSFTLDAAYGAHQDKVLGTLEPGKWADFIVIDKNIFKSPISDIWQPKVIGTWVGGKQIYSAQQK